MTKKEAIEFIKNCDKDIDAPYGYFVCAISREDLAVHCSDEVIENFDKLSKSKKVKVLSSIADELNETYQEYEFENDIESMEMDFELLGD